MTIFVSNFHVLTEMEFFYRQQENKNIKIEVFFKKIVKVISNHFLFLVLHQKQNRFI